MSVIAAGRVRRDALPEGATYQDDGCRYHPQCLSCPFPVCIKYELPNSGAALSVSRNPQIIALRAEGASVDDIAERFGLSPRSVFRVLSGALPSQEGGRCPNCGAGYRANEHQRRCKRVGAVA